MFQKLLYTLFLLLFVFYNTFVAGFWTITSLEVCEFDISVQPNEAGYTVPTMTGVYDWEGIDNPGEEGEYLPFRRSPRGQFRKNQRGKYFFVRDSGSNPYELRVFITNAKDFFTYLWDNRLSCTCDNANTFNEPFNPPNAGLNYFLKENGEDGTLGWIQNINSFKLCATWEDIDDDQQDLEDTQTNNLFTNYGTPDEWECEEQVNACSLFTEVMTYQYRGFEVFSDEGQCQLPSHVEIEAYDDGTGLFKWGCHDGQCNSGYRNFFVNPGSSDPDMFDQIDHDQRLHKCLNCATYFGNHCTQCGREGCYVCDIEPEDNLIVVPGSVCIFQYCGQHCCDEEGSTPSPTAVDSCTEMPISRGGWGLVALIYNCFTDDDQQAARGLVSEAYAAGDFWLPDHYLNNDGTNCESYHCIDINDNHCVEETCLSEEDDEWGCPECDDDSFWYSDSMPCVPCSDFTDGCLQCQDGTAVGGGGCYECEDTHQIQYDVDLGVYYCILKDDNIPEVDPEDIDDSWDQGCLEECDLLRGFGNNLNCDCGCTCNDDPVCVEDGESDVNPNCAICHFGAGCNECDEGFFQLSKQHPCLQCQETFGNQCEHCQDFLGCAQCAQGWNPVVSNCCGFTYCIRDTP